MDTRRIACGADLRRFGPSPEDAARAEALTVRHGGQVLLYGLNSGCAVRWVADTGLEVTAVGPTYAAALADVQRRIDA